VKSGRLPISKQNVSIDCPVSRAFDIEHLANLFNIEIRSRLRRTNKPVPFNYEAWSLASWNVETSLSRLCFIALAASSILSQFRRRAARAREASKCKLFRAGRATLVNLIPEGDSRPFRVARHGTPPPAATCAGISPLFLLARRSSPLPSHPPATC